VFIVDKSLSSRHVDTHNTNKLPAHHKNTQTLKTYIYTKSCWRLVI